MFNRLTRLLPRNRLTADDRPVGVRRTAPEESPRWQHAWLVTDDEESRLIRKWVTGVVLNAVVPLLVFFVLYYCNPWFLHIDITPD